MARRKKTRSRRKGLPHPSITSLAGGMIIAKRLNEGAHPDSTITGDLMGGNFKGAVNKFITYAPALVTMQAGQKALIQGIGVAVIGAGLRKAMPNVKLGSSRVYMRI